MRVLSGCVRKPLFLGFTFPSRRASADNSRIIPLSSSFPSGEEESIVYLLTLGIRDLLDYVAKLTGQPEREDKHYTSVC